MTEKDQNENGSKKLSFYIKLISSILGLFVFIGSIIFAVETRYATSIAVAKQKNELNKNIELVSYDLLKTIQQDRKNSDIRFYQQLINQSHDEETKLQQILIKFPNDENIRRRIEYEKQKQQQYRQKVNKLLSN